MFLSRAISEAPLKGTLLDASDQQRFAKLFEQCAPNIRALVWAVVRYQEFDASLVRDIMQEIQMAAWKSFNQYDRTRSFRPWLSAIARNVAIQQLRRASVQRREKSFAPETLEAIEAELNQVTARDDLADDELIAALRSCLGSLKSGDRQMVEWVCSDMKSLRALSEQLGLTFEAGRQRFRRALLWLRDCIRSKLNPGAAGV